MGTKRLKYNKETNIIEVTEEESQSLELIETKATKQKQRRGTVNFIISILSFIISVGALGISYSQKHINEKQADVSIRQFELNKKPVFECSIEQEELYNDDEYWQYYKEWLDKNEIKSFDEWYYHKFSNGNIFNETDKRKFWNLYENNDTEGLAEITDGKFEGLEFEYAAYLFSTCYISYDWWKDHFYIFKKEYITLKNVGANITNARLEVYTFKEYQISIGENISYSFAIDMGNYVFNETWLGRYSTTKDYDSGNNSFYIEYTQSVQSNKCEYFELVNLSNYLSSKKFYDEIGIDRRNTTVFLNINNPVYFSITYLDNEQEEQTDWYQYYKESNTLYYVETYGPNVKGQDLKEEGFNKDYFEAEDLCIEEILGYQNSQQRPLFYDPTYWYIEKAKRKIIADLKELVKNDVTENNESKPFFAH